MLCVSPEWFEKMYSLLANITTHLHACLWLLQSMWDSVGTLLASKLAGRYRFFKNPPVQVCLSVFLSCFHMCDEHAGKPGNSGKWQIISHHNASKRWLFLKKSLSILKYTCVRHLASFLSLLKVAPILTRLLLKYLFTWLCLSNASWSVFEHCLNKDGRESPYAPTALTSAGVKHQMEKGVKFSVSTQVKCFHLPGARAA